MIPTDEDKMAKTMQLKTVLLSEEGHYAATRMAADPYYTFFSLTAQCVKLNAKNFNRVISVYFNLEE